MPLIGWIRYYNKQARQKKLKKLLQEKGFSDEEIASIDGALFYTFELNEREKEKFCKRIPNVTRQQIETRFNDDLIDVFRDLDMAQLILNDKKQALLPYQECSALFEELKKEAEYYMEQAASQSNQTLTDNAQPGRERSS